ncbi:NACHT and WD repeat domain-containing protein 2-like [Mizuhopecten yessoensis]|uniref:NACHT domain-containing protein n=1 Tax=Mizuhopecten yessoensis TaxID=6573 RepID=A0A210Q2U6_MIZYE|nr:NACHT and WD repeat domain-containing protein 2-like [Mizuhopecten yessoensis]XP_021368708.1 NACHT and WD repeat domain-containing protein 2-like [Mizuhopecten yessoensis]OWF43078.1 hypothetical protein KP79_PYT21592 [Mizuhopecten yessoensis]
MDVRRVKAVLRGSMLDLPYRNSRVVRIFISSTFTDTREERNLLIEEVHPKLTSYCRKKYGLEYQVVDMRWGVPDDAADDHLATSLCLQEIQNCQRLSTGPNFVTFLNQKHGFHHLQSSIPSKEFDELIQALQTLDQDHSLLDVWYKQDTNCIPPVHILQPISSIITEYKNKTSDAVNEWNRVQINLRQLLKTASQHCFDNGKMGAEEKHKYFMSVTEEEVLQGILKTAGKPKNHCLCFIRIIDDLQFHLRHNKASRFIDMVNQEKVDEEAQEILSNLRDETVFSKMESSNISKKNVKWSEQGGISKEEHSQYLCEFGDIFYTGVKQLIDKAVQEELKLAHDDIYLEVLQHLTMAKERCSMFHGREDVLERVATYLCGDSNEPLTVFGPSGSGKTSIMAEVARQVPFTYKKDAIIILRFLGTSPASSNLWRLLKSLVTQILSNINGDLDSIPAEFNKLLAFFQSLIEKYDQQSSKPLVILLDSLDQLSSDFGAHKLRWLPKKLGKNVRIVTSTYTESNDIINSLKSLFLADSFIMVKILGEDISVKILKTWLLSRNRTLNNEQLDYVQEAFKKCSLPLYVKLVFEDVLTWKSYTQVTVDTLSYTVQEIINSLLLRLETKHGKIFVSRTLAYITASQSGISEAELEDVLSLDDTLLTSVFQYHVPPFRRIPSALWVRVRHDIGSYLVDKEVDDTRVFFWYHRQFYEAAEKRYLSDSKFSMEVHSLLADFYLGTWHNKQKPFQYSESQYKKLGLASPNSEADRKVADQPISFHFTEDEVEEKRFNLRKLNKLPFHLINADRNSELRSICLFNYDWLLAKLTATSVQQLLSDFLLSRQNKDGILQRVLKTAQSTLAKYPKTLAMEISGHLLPLLSDAKNSAEKFLVEDCLNRIRSDKATLPYQTCYNTPKEALLFKFEHQGIPFGCSLVAISNDSSHLIALAENNVLVMWDLTTGEIEQQVNLFDPDIVKLNIMMTSPEQNLAMFYSSYQKQRNQVVVVNMSTGDILNCVSLEKTYPGVGFTDSLSFVLTETKIICMYIGHSADLFDRQTGKHISQFDVVADDMFLLPEQDRIMFRDKMSRKYRLFDVNSGEKLAETEIQQVPKKVIPDPSGKEAVVIFKDSSTFSVIGLDTNNKKLGCVLSERNISQKTPTSLVITDVKFALDKENLLLTTNQGFVLHHYKSNRKMQAFVIPDDVKPDHKVLSFEGHMTPDRTFFVSAYEGYLIVWDTETSRVLQTMEISRSKITAAIMSENGYFLVTTHKRNNVLTVWRISSLVSKQVSFEPITIKSAPRYMDVSERGQTAVMRGNMSNEVAILDILGGCIKFYISKDYEVMQPVITPDGEHVVLREYSSENVLKVWSTGTGHLCSSVPLSSLLVKYHVLADDKMAVYVNNAGEAQVSFWSIPASKHINTLELGAALIGDMFMFFDSTSDNIVISESISSGEVYLSNLVVYNIETGEKRLTFPRVVSCCTHPLVKDKDLVLLQQCDEGSDTKSLIVLDIKSGEVRKKGSICSPTRLFTCQDGRYGIDRLRNLYNLEKMTLEFQYDPDGDYPKRPSNQASPKLSTDGHIAVWANVYACLLMIGDTQTGTTTSICPVHSIPLSLTVTLHDLLLIGCEDGRLMLLQLVSDTNKESNFISGFLSRHKNHSQKTRVVKYKGSNKIQGQKVSKTCSLL